MAIYRYEFCNRTVNEIKVGEEWYGILISLDKWEKNNNRRNTRRHVSLNYLNTFGLDIEASGGDPLAVLIKSEDRAKLLKALWKLQQQQRALVEKLFFNGEKKADIAEAESVSCAAITDRLKKIYKRLKNILQEGA